MNEREFLQEVADVGIESRANGLDILYDRIDDMILDGQFDEVESLIQGFMPHEWPVWMVIGVITITFNARVKFYEAYVAMLHRAAKSFAAKRGPEEACQLLKGLL